MRRGRLASTLQTVRVGDQLFVASQSGIDPASSGIVDAGIAAQTEQVLNRIAAIRRVAGDLLPGVVKATVFLNTSDEFAGVDGTYTRFYAPDQPVRPTAGMARWPMGAAAEIQVVAVAAAHNA